MHKKQLKESLKLLVAAIFAVLALGTVVFSLVEGWSLIDSFYFVTMTATTVGYGDFIPTHTLSKIITIIYSLLIIPFILYAFSVLAKYEIARVYRQMHGLERKQQEQEEDIDKTEKRLAEQRRKLKEQEEEIEKQQRKLGEQIRINKEQEEELKWHQKKIKKQEKEIKEHDEELEVVEDVVAETVAEKPKPKK